MPENPDQLSRMGTFSDVGIRALIEEGHVTSQTPMTPGQLQPASLDLRLGAVAYSVPGSMLPLPGETVEGLLERYARFKLDLSEGATLVRGQVYVVLLEEGLRLPHGVAGYANSKSSIGRIDVQTRVLTDGNPRFDKVPTGYSGPLWLEISPKSFDVRVNPHDSLNQIIFYKNRALLTEAEVAGLHAQNPLLYSPKGEALPVHAEGVLMTLDLDQDIVGWTARRSFSPVDLRSEKSLDPRLFFEPIGRPVDGSLYLSREAFYIFSTYEYVSIPGEYACEMLPYDMSAGEFRAHYAGFFDPGFGRAEGLRGTPAVLEVRPYEDDLIVRHRQPVCKMAFERLSEPPAVQYGQKTGLNHYAEQRGPRLSKFFKF